MSLPSLEMFWLPANKGCLHLHRLALPLLCAISQPHLMYNSTDTLLAIFRFF